MPKEPEYVSIAATLRAEIRAGRYDDAFPGSSALAERFDVNLKTAGRAVQHLVAEGLLVARPGRRPVVAPRDPGTTVWPMSGRYARARATGGLVFASDVDAAMRKETVSTGWVEAPDVVARLLRLERGTRVLHRASHTLVDDRLVELTSLYFPAPVVEAAPALEHDERITVVPLLEAAGHSVARTVNEIRARLATDEERAAFGLDEAGVVVEHTHGTYGSEGEPLEAVVDRRPGEGSVITFETDESTPRT